MNKNDFVENINEIIEFGLDTIADDKKITIELKDFIYLYKTIEELRRFFHNRNHYKSLENIYKYIGDKDNKGIFSVLDYLYLNKLDKLLTPEIEELLDSESLDYNRMPFYYKVDNKSDDNGSV